MVELDSGALNRRYVHPDVADYVANLCGHNCVHFEIQFWLYSWKFDRFNECIQTGHSEKYLLCCWLSITYMFILIIWSLLIFVLLVYAVEVRFSFTGSPLISSSR